MLKNKVETKTKNTPKMTPKWIHKSERILREIPLGAPLVVQTAFVMKIWIPALPKCAQGSTNEPNMTPKSSPSARMSSKSGPFSELGENELQKWTLFGSKPGGLLEALTIIRRPLRASSVVDYMLQASFQQSQKAKHSFQQA